MEGGKKRCCCNEICSLLQTAGVLALSAADQPQWLDSVLACCLRVRMSHLARRASRLCPPDTHWWLNGCVWVQDDDLAWWFHGAGQRWRRDIRAGWFDGDKKDVRSLGPQTCCHWRGLARVDEMWVTAARVHNIPQPQSPCTLFSNKEPIYYKYCHKAGQ